MKLNYVRSPESPGFLFWYEAQHEDGPRVTYGLNAVKEVGNDVCTMVRTLLLFIFIF